MNQTNFSLDTYRIKGKKFAVNVDDPNNATVNGNTILTSPLAVSTTIGGKRPLLDQTNETIQTRRILVDVVNESVQGSRITTSADTVNVVSILPPLFSTPELVSVVIPITAGSYPPYTVNASNQIVLPAGNYNISLSFQATNLTNCLIQLMVNGVQSQAQSSNQTSLAGVEDARRNAFTFNLSVSTLISFRVYGAKQGVGNITLTLPSIAILKSL